MNTININRKDLLQKIIANRDKHEAEYKEAIIAYRLEAIKQFKIILNNAENNREFDRSIRLPEPLNYANDYNRIINMLTMSVDDVITLDSHDFDQYVMDNWSWKNVVGTTNSFYLSKK